MSRIYELRCLPTIINSPGKYQTRCGETVTINRISKSRLGGPEWAHGHYENGTPESWDISGRLLPFSLSANDVVKGNSVECTI